MILLHYLLWTVVVPSVADLISLPRMLISFAYANGLEKTHILCWVEDHPRQADQSFGPWLPFLEAPLAFVYLTILQEA